MRVDFRILIGENMALKAQINSGNAASGIYFRFIAITVHDLKKAEQFYREVFDMEIIGREAMLEDGLWYTLPFDKGWNEADSEAIDLGMIALRKNNIVLVLFRGEPAYGQIYAIGLSLPAEEIARVKLRLTDEVEETEASSTYLSFRDPYQITWQISEPGVEFRTAGDFAGRWLKI